MIGSDVTSEVPIISLYSSRSRRRVESSILHPPNPRPPHLVTKNGIRSFGLPLCRTRQIKLFKLIT